MIGTLTDTFRQHNKLPHLSLSRNRGNDRNFLLSKCIDDTTLPKIRISRTLLKFVSSLYEVSKIAEVEKLNCLFQRNW